MPPPSWREALAYPNAEKGSLFEGAVQRKRDGGSTIKEVELMNQITTQYVTEGGACYEQYVITDPAAKTALTITP